MYVKTNKKCLYIVFELCEFYDEEFYEKINVYLCLFFFRRLAVGSYPTLHAL